MSTAMLVEKKVSVSDDLKNGRRIINFDVQRFVEPVIAGWRIFLALPREVKDTFTFEEPGDPEGPDEGYIPRGGDVRPDGIRNDVKQFFHYKKGLLDKLALRSAPRWREQLLFLTDLRVLYDYCLDCAFKQVKLIDVELGTDFHSQMTSVEAEKLHCLRLLSYCIPKSVGQTVGKFHVDRNFFTIHVDETHPGLVLKTPDGDKKYRKKPGTALIFPSAKAALATGGKLVKDNTVEGGTLPGLAHGVVSEPEGQGVERISVVFFSHIPGDLYLPRLH